MISSKHTKLTEAIRSKITSEITGLSKFSVTHKFFTKATIKSEAKLRTCRTARHTDE